MIVKDIILKRKVIGNQRSLFGILEIHSKNNGIFYFSTVENNDKKIQEGTYTIGYTPSNKFGRETLQILRVPNRYGIRIHSANRGIELEGCIAVGLVNHQEEIPQQVFFSRHAVTMLESILCHKEHKITIKDINNGKKNTIKNSREHLTKVA
jgi:hypothetical protein